MNFFFQRIPTLLQRSNLRSGVDMQRGYVLTDFDIPKGFRPSVSIIFDTFPLSRRGTWYIDRISLEEMTRVNDTTPIK